MGQGKERDHLSIQNRPGSRRSLAADDGGKKRILLANIYGVDIDTQAVEVTKLSLLLKVLEDESAELIDNTLKFFQERALPDLENNIKCGNSLIAPDFYADKAPGDFDLDARLKINAFDWHKEFAPIMDGGGFDAVIGNPPYIFGEYQDAVTKLHIQQLYTTAAKQFDTYWIFIEKGLKLTKAGGSFSLIVPDALLARDEAVPPRELLLGNGLNRVYHCGLVFENASVSAVVFVCQKGKAFSLIQSERMHNRVAYVEHECEAQNFRSDPLKKLLVHASKQEQVVLTKMQHQNTILKKIIKISRGEELGKKDVRFIDEVPITVGSDIERYSIQKPTRFVASAMKSSAFYESPKLVVVKTGQKCIVAFDDTDAVTMQSVYNIHVTDANYDAKAIMGILNSRLISFWIDKTCTAYKFLFPQLNQSTLETIPIPAEQAKHDKMVSLVDRMLTLHKNKAAVRLAREKAMVEQQITETDAQIDRLVYDLYGLTDEERAIVEGAG